VAVTSQALGSAYLALGEADAAAAHLGRALTLHGELEEPLGVATTLDAVAELAAVGGSPDVAARHLGAAQGIRVAMGAAAEPAEEARRAQTREAAAGAIGARAFEDAFAAGLGTEIGRAIELALASID
jgi:hypothetical protein